MRQKSLEASGEATQVAVVNKLVKMNSFVLFDGRCFKRKLAGFFLKKKMVQKKPVLIQHVQPN